VLCEIDLSQHLLLAPITSLQGSSNQKRLGQSVKPITLRSPMGATRAIAPADDTKSVAVYELGPVDLYICLVEFDRRISISLTGYVSDLFHELARLHHIPFFVVPRLTCGEHDYSTTTPLHQLPRRRLLMLHVPPMPPLGSLHDLRHARNVFTSDVGLTRTARVAVGLFGNIVHGTVKLPFHPHYPVQELEIAEISVHNILDRDAKKDGDRSEAPGLLSSPLRVDVAEPVDVSHLGRAVITKLDAIADLLHPNVQSLVCIVTAEVDGVQFPRNVCFEHCGDGDVLSSWGEEKPIVQANGSTFLSSIRHMRE